MKKTTPKYQKYLPIVYTILSTLIVLAAVEYLFAIPSRFFHSEPTVKKDITNSVEIPVDLKKDDAKICTREYMPVCGADGKTYTNACMANANGTIVGKEGACDDTNLTDTVSSTGAREPGLVSGEIVGTDYADTSKFHVYKNTSLGYTMSFPNYVYYQGYGARDGASHTMAMALTQSGVESFDSADVRVYFYRGSVPTDAVAGAMLVKTEKGTLMIDSKNSTLPKIQKIVDTIMASAR